MDRSEMSAGAVASLPDDPLVDILSRVPVKSVRRFKCVSKAWRDLISDPLHGKKLPQTLEGFFYEERWGGCNEGSEDCGSKDSVDCSSEDSVDCSSEDLPRFYGHFVNVLGRSVDSCFSFVTELPGNEDIWFLHYCNGLFLMGRPCSSESDTSVSYIVCNPATKQWVDVPSSGWTSSLFLARHTFTYLTFDPATDSGFHLVQFWMEADERSVHTYSSKTGAWSHKKCDLLGWGYYSIAHDSPNAYVNGMLHLILYDGKKQLGLVNVEGNMQKLIPPPVRAGRESDYLGQSQGRLHYIEREMWTNEFLIWILEDYDTQQWVLKDTVSFSKLFGEHDYKTYSGYNVVAIHPDHNLVYLVHRLNQKLISYNMDSKQVRDVCTLEHEYQYITPYVPFFSNLSSLGMASKQ